MTPKSKPASTAGVDAGLGATPDGALSPYIGIRPFSEEDEPLFFGRDREVSLVASNLVASSLTLLYGPSGVGKSSLLRAGVVPLLRRMAVENREEDEGPELFVAVFSSWRDDPVPALLRCIGQCMQPMLGAEPAFDATTPNALLETVRRWCAEVDGDLLIILDQFEEFFLYHERSEDGDRFADELATMVNETELPVNFLISLREDALARLDRFKGRIPRLFGNYLRVDYLARERALRAILGPVEHHNRERPAAPVAIEPELALKVLDEVTAGKVVVGQAGAGRVDGSQDLEALVETSHLQIVMAKIWSEETRLRSKVLRVETLERLGGAEQIIRGHVDEELETLSAAERDAAALAFKYLVTPSGTKIAHSAPDLAYLSGASEDELTVVLKRLSSGNKRILRPVAPQPGQTHPRFEIFHDVLGAAVVDWRTRHELDAAHLRAQVELRLQAEQVRRTEREARRRRRNRRIFLLTMATLAIVAIAFLLYAQNQQRLDRADRSRELAATAISRLSVDPAESTVDALDALDLAETPEAERALRHAVAQSQVRFVLTGHGDSVHRAAFSPSGSQVVTVSRDATVRLWNADTGGQTAVLEGHAGSVNDVSISDDGSQVVTASDDRTARIWDIGPDGGSGPDGARRNLLLEGHGDRVTSARFDGAGKRVVTASWDRTARVWDAATGAQIAVLTGSGGELTGASFGAGDTVVTSGLDGAVRVWDTATGAQLAVLQKHLAAVTSSRFNPDGTVIASADENGVAYLWRWQSPEDAIPMTRHTRNAAVGGITADHVLTYGDKTVHITDIRTGALLTTLRGHSDWVYSAAFSRDGRRVATASGDGSVRVWDPATGSVLLDLRGHVDAVLDVAFAPDGQALVSASADRTARLWELPASRRLIGHRDWVVSAEFSPDGQQVVTAGADGTARVWLAGEGQQLTVLQPEKGPLSRAVFHPSGEFVLVTAGRSGVLQVWDLQQVKPVAELVSQQQLQAAEFLGGDTVMLLTAVGEVQSWAWRTDKIARRVSGRRGGLAATDLQVSHDGRRVLTAGTDGVARIWDADTGREEIVLRGHDATVYSAEYSQDDRLIVTSSADGSVRLWDAHNGDLLRTMQNEEGTYRAASFSSDGTRIVAGSADGLTVVWETSTGSLLASLRRHGEAGMVNTARFSRDGSQILTASDDQTAQIYRCESCAPLAELRALAQRRVQTTGQLRDNSMAFFELTQGDCFKTLDEERVQLVPCSSAHDREVFAVVEHPAGFDEKYDHDALAAYADDQCRVALKRDPDQPGDLSKVEIDHWEPSAGTWGNGNRKIVCALVTTKSG